MKNGFYWYVPNAPDEEVEPVKVEDGEVWSIGAEMGLDLDFMLKRGSFEGPLQQPAR